MVFKLSAPICSRSKQRGKEINIIFKTNTPKILVPLDACNEVVLQVEDFKQIKNKSLQQILIPMMEHFIEGLSSDEGTKGILVYDALAAFFLLSPQSFKLKQMNIVIETKGEHTAGMSVAEKREYKIEETNVEVVIDIKEGEFKKSLFELLSKK